MDKPETFKCCDCGLVRPFDEAWAMFADCMNVHVRWEEIAIWCDKCEDIRQKEINDD